MTTVEVNFIDAEKLRRMQMLHVRFLLFDVRSQEAFQKGHIKSALNLPFAEFIMTIKKQVPVRETPVVIYDEDGTVGGELAQQCEQMGYLNIVVLEGGIKSYLVSSS